MVPSSDSIACATLMLNAAVAESLRQYADALEQAEDFETALHALIRDSFRAHRRILFNGNGYDEAWLQEAEKRGLCNYRSTADALPHLLDEKNVALLTKHRVYSETELRARCETLLDNYCKTVRIEAKTMLWMTRRQILPAVSGFAAELSERAVKRKALLPETGCIYESSLAAELSSLIDEIHRRAAELEDALLHSGTAGTGAEDAAGIRDALLPRMQSLRIACDEAETKTEAQVWPFPSYAELLFSV